MNTKTFDNALLNLFYTIALLNDSTIESKKTLRNLFMRDYLPSEMMPAQLLALYALNEKMESAIEHILYNYRQIFTISQSSDYAYNTSLSTSEKNKTKHK